MAPGPIAERLPGAVRSLLQLGLSLAVILGVVLAVDRFDRLHENVVPRQDNPAWSTTQVPAAPGDSWVGDVASDGTSIYLVTREAVDGFWGTIHVRRSLDGGTSWIPSVLVSDASPVSAARARDCGGWDALRRLRGAGPQASHAVAGCPRLA